MKKYGFGALVAAGLLAGGLSAGSASAADLGGNCCADLEERIAELEATTARKGNRKVSLTLSGWVAEQVMWWDDGVESNVYVGGIGTTLASHFKLTGQATISPGWYAGYVIQVEVYGSETLLAINQNVATGSSLYGGGNSGLNTLQSFWFIKSDHLGKLSVGKQSQASDNTAILVDGSGSLVPANFVAFEYGGFFLRGTNGSTGSNWFTAMGCTDCNGIPLNSVRYDSPTFGGFSASASWGEDDFWDVAARYAGEHGGFKVAVAAAYSEATDSNTLASVPNGGLIAQAPDTEFFQVGGYVEHVATGLFLYGAYGQLEAMAGPDLNDFWYVKAGLRERWSPLGHTVLYGEYQRSNNDAGFGLTGLSSNVPNVNCNNVNECTSEVEMFGVGVVQEIDAAAMSLWVSYRHLSADVHDNFVITGDVPTEDFDMVKAGALINF
ncbi:MAG: porin [Hyphomicrobium sp.]|uniref:porin n=1 Tax=Hyphomicrobium sp. TaxID=82 RepID=UPI001321BD5F|nr:porin [Hyphomicrobium sp.]KAB2938274.1 MAG: porin [Hyphomicrobium sp.]MBZ0211273.1 porin [Hyphomicrobium sp.]